MALIQSFALSLAIDADAAFEAARQGGKNVAAKAAIRVNVITLIKDQTTPVIVSTVGDGRDHHFGTLLGSVRWSKTRKEYVVSLNDAIVSNTFKAKLHAAFAEGLGIDKTALKIDTAPLLEVEPIETLKTLDTTAPPLA